MIVVLCANPALDRTYRVEGLVPGGVHRPADTARRPGGKGTNVARVVQDLGAPVRWIGPLGGPTGAAFLRELGGVAGAMDVRPVSIVGDTRTSVAIVDGDDATVVNEAGPDLTPGEWRRVVDATLADLTVDDVLVLAGSLPPGVPDDAYAELVRASDAARCVVDTTGAALRAAGAAHPAVLAPNVHEVRAAFGLAATGADELAAWLHEATGAAAVVSNGADGLAAVSAEGSWRCAPPRRIAGNPTGAGDALTAALAVGLSRYQSWPDVLASAVATSAAAVAAPVAGQFDAALRAELLGGVRVVATDGRSLSAGT